MDKKEQGSVVLAFAGFAVLVLLFKGTWGRAYGALVGHKTPGGASAPAAQSASSSGQLAYPVSPGTLAFQGVTAGRPGQAPTPTTQTVAQTRTRTTDKQGLGYNVDLADFERGNVVQGYNVQQVLAIARSQEPLYAGRRYSPHNIADNGQIHTDAKGRFIRVKFADPAGIMATSTENVYLPK